MTVSEGNRLLALFSLGENAIGEALAAGPDGRRGKVDLLRGREFRGRAWTRGEARVFRVDADWPDGAEDHEATCEIEFRGAGAPRCGRGYRWAKWEGNA
jgi:hypothetical protein